MEPVTHIDFAVNRDCENTYDSYGEICVRCNSCGRFNKETMWKDRLNVYKRHLAEDKNFDGWIEGMEELQRKNKQANVEYLEKLIREAEGHIGEIES